MISSYNYYSGLFLNASDIQMVRIDERQEAVAFIRMTIDNAQEALRIKNQDLNLDLEPDLDNLEAQSPASDGEPEIERSWKFGSPEGRRITSHVLEANLAPLNRDYSSFDQRLRAFIGNNLPKDALRYEDEIYVGFSTMNQIQVANVIQTDPPV